MLRSRNEIRRTKWHSEVGFQSDSLRFKLIDDMSRENRSSAVS
jgi:hypothetical protein